MTTVDGRFPKQLLSDSVVFVAFRRLARVVADVVAVASQLRAAVIEASEAELYPEYALDYWTTFFTDPGGIRREVTNYQQERRDRHDNW